MKILCGIINKSAFGMVISKSDDAVDFMQI